MVLQDTWLFSGTIMENIRYGRLDATDEEILLVSAGHYETEFPAVVSLCKLLEDKFKDIQFKVAEQKTPIKNI